jgi:signal transduction histidine kinase
MNRTLVLVARLGAVLAVAAAVVLGIRLHRARADLTLARADAEHLASQLTDILTLSRREQTAVTQAPPEGAVATALLATLARCNIPAESMLQQSTSAEEPVVFDGGSMQPGVSYARRSVGVTLSPVSLAQLGQFIRDWKANQPVWVPTRIDLNHVGDQAQAAYTVTLRLTATYVASRPESAPTRPAPQTSIFTTPSVGAPS